MKDDFRFDENRDPARDDFSRFFENDSDDSPREGFEGFDDDFTLPRPERVPRSEEVPILRVPAETAPRRPGKPKKKKKQSTGCLKSFVWIAVIGLVSVALAVGIILIARDILAIGKSSEPVAVEIEQGMSTVQIAEKLKEEGIIEYPNVFRLYTKLMKNDGQYRYGVYYFSPSMGYEAVAERLKKEGKRADSVRFTVRDGDTVDNIFSNLEKEGICSVENLKKAMNTETFEYRFLQDLPKNNVRYYLEGYLFPDTYEFFPDDSVTGATMILNTMLKNLDKRLTNAHYAEAERRNLTMHQILTMASVVELEASGRADEMKKVAAVFYNRLAWTDQPNLLGSTPTQKYPDKRYDTNKNPGLPPGPLNSPSMSAIEAALYPEKGFPYYYFVTDAKMEFYYNKTLEEHNRTINRLKAANNWIY